MNIHNPSFEVVRYEGTRERLFRVVTDEDLRLRYPNGYNVTVLRGVLFGEILRESALFPTLNKNLPKTNTFRCSAFLEQNPNVRFEFSPPGRDIGRCLDAVYYKNGDESVYNIGPAMSMGPMVMKELTLFKKTVLFVQGETVIGNSDRYETDYLITDIEEGLEPINAFLTGLIEIDNKANNVGRKINVYGSDSAIELGEASHATWGDVFLSEEVTKAVKDDIEFFLGNEKVFREVGIPYKRGYLLTGPPGNGKSSIARVLATSMPFQSFMFDFSNPDMGNSDLTEAFKWATAVAPSVFFLEDIDRIFDPDTGPKTRVTMDHLLNCLDGIKVNDGLVVVATANNPKVLDSAILSRPGRFDKVVQIDVPDHHLRERYLTHLFRKLPSITAKDVTYMADETEGVSMAFLKEVFVVTASRAIMANETPSRKHVDDALAEILKQYGGISRCNTRKAGFGA